MDLVKKEFSQDQVELIKRTIAKDATDDELKLFLFQAQKTGLDPLQKQIYFIKVGEKIQTITSIDGFRLIAERSGFYEGQTQPIFYDENGVAFDVWVQKKLPTACKIGVYKKGFREALYAIAIFEEYAKRSKYGNKYGKKAGDLEDMWEKMPSLMLSKVAEALALRKAFPNDLGGVYTNDEFDNVQKSEFSEVRKEEFIGDEKVKILSDLIFESKSDMAKFLSYAKVNNLKELKEENYQTLKKILLLKIETAEKENKKNEVAEVVEPKEISFTIDDVEFDETGKIKK